MNYKKPFLIAEIGCNHKGDISIAKEMISVAKYFCKVDCVKFQKRNNVELLTEEQFNTPHPNPENSYGETYGEHREFLELSIEEHKELKEYCDALGIVYSTSVWDLISAKEICSLNPEFIKIPSACNNNLIMLEWLIENYSGEIHISTGMTTKNEIDAIIELFDKDFSKKSRLVIYNCTSGYPVPFKDICLLEINELKNKYANKVKSLGFSGHHLGIAIDIAAYTLGANYIERHYTLDRTWKGTDHAASLEPQGLRTLQRNLNVTYESLSLKRQEILEIEMIQREKLKYKK